MCMMKSFELFVENRAGQIQVPIVVDGATWETRRAGAPGKLTFEVMRDASANFHEGNPVRLTVDGKNIFFGFVFSKRRDKEHIIKVTAYDQLRYLKNVDTYIYTNKRASDVIRMVAADFELQVGSIAQTSHVIPERDESNSSLFDIILTALDLELVHAGNMFVLYDDFGKLTLKPISDMRIPIVFDDETGENFDYESTINSATYNRIKLVRENDTTGMRDVYVVQHGRNIDRWGVLQYFGTLAEGENGQAKAAALLDLFNAKRRRLSILSAFGDTRIRAGSMPIVDLNLGDIVVRHHMLVEKCVHTFRESEHWMDLTFRGGDIHG